MSKQTFKVVINGTEYTRTSKHAYTHCVASGTGVYSWHKTLKAAEKELRSWQKFFRSTIAVAEGREPEGRFYSADVDNARAEMPNLTIIHLENQ